MMKLSNEEKDALKAIENGADVYGRGVAQILRNLWKEHPEWIDICAAMDAPEDGAKQQPYFGAILTAKGKKSLKGIE